MNIDEPVPGGFVIPGRGRRRQRRPSSQHSNRLPLLRLLPKSTRGHFVAMCGEFAGTFLFLFFAFSGTQVANTQTQSATSSTLSKSSNPAQLLYISLCFGFSLAVNAWVFFRISGGLFNPAVTFGMCLVGALPYIRGFLLFVAQMIGAISAAAVVSALFPGPLSVRTSIAQETSVVQGLFIEMFLTAQLIFTIFMLAAEKHKATFIAPVGIGLSLFVAELTGVFYTGGSLNPARSFGPCVVLHSFDSYHWIYWVGPILGTLLASGFYKFMKMLEYETANPGQDFDEKKNAHFNSNPEDNSERPDHVVQFENSDANDYDHGVHHFKSKEEQSLYDSNGAAHIGSHEPGVSAMKGEIKETGSSLAGDTELVTQNKTLRGAFTEGPYAEAGLIRPETGRPSDVLV